MKKICNWIHNHEETTIKIMHITIRAINCLTLLVLGMFTGVAIEYGMNADFATGIISAVILAALSFYAERSIIRNWILYLEEINEDTKGGIEK